MTFAQKEIIFPFSSPQSAVKSLSFLHYATEKET
jgi:hypothetical protein